MALPDKGAKVGQSLAEWELGSHNVLGSSWSSETTLPKESGQTLTKQKAPDNGRLKLLIALVAGGGFEAPTFGL